MILGIGVDILSLQRFEKTLEVQPAIRDKIISEQEDSITLSRLHIAKSFAAKEALWKSLKSISFSFKEVQLVELYSGAPSFRFTGATSEILKGISFEISLSHDAGFLIAIVIAFK